MLPASLAAWVPVFIATATSACARAGASLVAVSGHGHQPALPLHVPGMKLELGPPEWPGPGNRQTPRLRR